jgi:TPR repeat protein
VRLGVRRAGGDSAGCHDLADLFEQGLGVGKDEARATSFYARGCTLGEPDSCAKACSLGDAESCGHKRTR